MRFRQSISAPWAAVGREAFLDPTRNRPRPIRPLSDVLGAAALKLGMPSGYDTDRG